MTIATVSSMTTTRERTSRMRRENAPERRSSSGLSPGRTGGGSPSRSVARLLRGRLGGQQVWGRPGERSHDRTKSGKRSDLCIGQRTRVTFSVEKEMRPSPRFPSLPSIPINPHALPPLFR